VKKQDQRTALENELAELIRRHGPEAIRKTLHELTRGRPLVPVDDLFQIWLAIEVLLRGTPRANVVAACANCANKKGIRKLIPKHQLGKRREIEYEQQTIAGNAETIRRKYGQAKRLLANDPFLRHAWQRQLEIVCGGQPTAPRQTLQSQMQESFEISAKRWAETTRLFPLKKL